VTQFLHSCFIFTLCFQEEIGEVFEKWNNLSVPSNFPTKPCYAEATKNSACDKKYRVGTEGAIVDEKKGLSFSKPCTLLPSRHQNNCSFEKYLNVWSESLLAEFNTIIQDSTSSGVVESVDDDYDEVAGDSDDDSMRMRYRISQRDDFDISSSSSPTVSPSTSEHSSSGSSGSDNTRRTPPYLSRMGRNKQRSDVASVNSKHDPRLVNVKIYSKERPKVPEMRKAAYEFENSHHVSKQYIFLFLMFDHET
jgi:hypothetical protein